MSLRTQRVVSASSAYTVEDQERMKRARRYFQWQFRLTRLQLGQRVLEIGCGLGNFTRLIADRECVIAIDVDEACLQSVAASLALGTNVIVHRMSPTDDDFGTLARYQPDSIVCLNVLEHIADDRLALANMNSVLPVGGKVVLIVPAFESLYGPIDVNLGHHRRYSKRGLSELARAVGFRPTCVRYMNFLGFFGWWFNARVLKRTKQSESQIAIFDSVLVPLQSRLERLVEPPCGQSIFAVLEKQPRHRLSGDRTRLVSELGHESLSNYPRLQ